MSLKIQIYKLNYKEKNNKTNKTKYMDLLNFFFVFFFQTEYNLFIRDDDAILHCLNFNINSAVYVICDERI